MITPEFLAWVLAVIAFLIMAVIIAGWLAGFEDD